MLTMREKICLIMGMKEILRARGSGQQGLYDHDEDAGVDDAQTAQPEPIAPNCGRRGGRGRSRGRGGGANRGHRNKAPAYSWKDSNTCFSDEDFMPNQTPGPYNIPDNVISDESTCLDWLSLLWPNELWQLLVDETNNQAECIKVTKPNHYYAKSFYPVTMDEMKAFFGCRVV